MSGLPDGKSTTVKLINGEAASMLATLDAGSIDAVICDPPYPEIDRPYGRMTEAAWHEMMHKVVAQCRRILKPKGSAVFVLQPNSRKVGSMRPWLFEFQAWACREWNMIQDIYWWNFTRPPTVHCNRDHGLTRPSVKACVWLGAEDCYRDQNEVLWTSSDANIAARTSSRLLEYHPSGGSMRRARCSQASDERGGVTPFNLLPIASTSAPYSAGALGHGAGTPMDLCHWWMRYISRPGDVICDPFCGSGTMGAVAVAHGRSFVGIDLDADYIEMSRNRIDDARRGNLYRPRNGSKAPTGSMPLFGE